MGILTKAITKTICSKGPKLFSAKGTASLYFCSDNLRNLIQYYRV